MRAFLVACIFAISMLPQSSVYASDNLYDVEDVASESVAFQSMDVTTVQELLKIQASEQYLEGQSEPVCRNIGTSYVVRCCDGSRCWIL